MTTNQTIDGVPREQLARWEELLRTPPGRQELLGELRALLDVSLTYEGERLDAKPTGLSQGWNLTRKHDGFVVGHQSAAYPPDEKAIERAERDGYVWVPFLVPAAQPQGEPVGLFFYDQSATEWYEVTNPGWAGGQLVPLYREQPAPVATPLDYGALDAVQRLAVCRGEK